MSVAWLCNEIEARKIVPRKFIFNGSALGPNLGHECPGYRSTDSTVEVRRWQIGCHFNSAPQSSIHHGSETGPGLLYSSFPTGQILKDWRFLPVIVAPLARW